MVAAWNICDTFGCGRYAADLTENREIYIGPTPPVFRLRWNFTKLFSNRNTRMIGLSHAEESMIQYRNVTDKRTDGQTDRRTDRIATPINIVHMRADEW